jgi:hypothetical protein
LDLQQNVALKKHFDTLKSPLWYSEDISEHLDVLFEIAKQCSHITEMGFRLGASFTALLLAQPKKLVTYDIYIPSEVQKFFLDIKGKTEIEFHQKNTLEIEIEETDFLFIDTLHTYDQLKTELELHGNKSKRFLGFHDTETYARKSEDGFQKGLMDAIDEWRQKNPVWKVVEDRKNNNGLLVLERPQWESLPSTL